MEEQEEEEEQGEHDRRRFDVCDVCLSLVIPTCS